MGFKSGKSFWNKVLVEQGEATFSHETSVTVTFTKCHVRVPKISLTPIGSGETAELDDGSSTGNLITFISSATITEFTVETSADFTGTVYYRAYSLLN